MADELKDSDPNLDAIPEDRTPSVDISMQTLMDITAERHVGKHERHCPASKAYQKMVGVVGLGLLMMGGLVWWGQSVVETKIDQAVKKAFQNYAQSALASTARPLSPMAEQPPVTWPPRALAATPLRSGK